MQLIPNRSELPLWEALIIIRQVIYITGKEHRQSMAYSAVVQVLGTVRPEPVTEHISRLEGESGNVSIHITDDTTRAMSSDGLLDVPATSGCQHTAGLAGGE